MHLVVWTDEQEVRHWIDAATNWCTQHEHRIPPQERVTRCIPDPRKYQDMRS